MLLVFYNIKAKIMEGNEKNFFQTEEYRKRYLKEMEEKEQKILEGIEIKDVSGKKVDTEKLFKKIDDEITNKKSLAGIVTDIVTEYKITKEDAVTAISRVNVLKHQHKNEGIYWETTEEKDKKDR